VGEVVARGGDVTEPELGARVFALAPHGDVHLLDASAVRALDPSLAPARATLAANLETAVTCVWDAGISLGDEVVVLGGGVVGLLAGWLSQAAGARVLLVEPSERRRAWARALGLHDSAASAEGSSRREADVVIEATGDPVALDAAIACAGREATIVIASFYGSRTHPLSLGSEFHRRRLTLRATQVSTVPPLRAPRWSSSRRFALVRSLLFDERLDRLVEATRPFDEAPGTYAELDAAPGEHGQVVFHYR
jgi:threonine dehydrogenase-like Zn-dependent dehydrogenase